MPGIEAGEIGPKVHGAMSAVDNGFARFNRVSIPRKNMLSRFARVEPPRSAGGSPQYVQPPHSKLSFGGMVYIRAQMIGSLAWQLARGTSTWMDQDADLRHGWALMPLARTYSGVQL